MLHEYPPQQAPASLMSQTSPGAKQPARRQRPMWQVSPEQQPESAVQLPNSCTQAQVPVVPPSPRLQCAPPQQSRSLEHTASRAWHWHVPVVAPDAMLQSMDPQHCREFVHCPICGRQQNDPPGCTPHA